MFSGTGAFPVAAIADFVDQLLAAEEIPDIAQGGLGNVALRFSGEERLMRGHNYIRERQETCQNIIVDCRIGTVFEKVIRFLLIDVEPCAADFFFFIPSIFISPEFMS